MNAVEIPTPPPAVQAPASKPKWKQLLSFDNRYLPPALITCILLGGQFAFGMLESWTRTLADGQRATFLAEHSNGQSMGFICVGACKLPVRDLEATAGEIQQLYVLSEFHGHRLGTHLMKLGVDWLVAQGRSPL